MLNAQLSPPAGFQQNVQLTGTQVKTIDAACNSVINIPNITSTDVPSLATDIANTKAIANQWLTDIRPKVMGTLQGIVNFNNSLQSFFAKLYSISVHISQGNRFEVIIFKSMLQSLQNASQKQGTAVSQVQNTLTSFLSQQVAPLFRTLNADVNQLNAISISYKNQLQDFTNQINDLDAQISKEKMEAGIIGAAPIVGPLAGLILSLLQRFEDLEGQKQKVQDQYNTMNNQLIQVNGLLSSLNNYSSSMNQVDSGLNALADAWESLSADLNEAISDENITDFNAFTPDLVKAAGMDWSVVANLAGSLL